MRIKYAKLVTFFIIVLNILIVYYTWKNLISVNNLNNKTAALFISSDGTNIKPTRQPTTAPNPKNRIQVTNKQIKKLVTIVFRDIYSFDNDLKNSIECITHLIPSIKILVIFNTTPYPPIEIGSNNTTKNIKVIHLDYGNSNSIFEINPLLQIRTKYVMFMPDSVRLNSRAILTKLIREFTTLKTEKRGNSTRYQKIEQFSLKDDHLAKVLVKKISKKLLTIPFISNKKTTVNCFHLNLDPVNWTIEYTMMNNTERCDMFIQKHAIMLETSLLKDMPTAMSLPFPEMLYIQAKSANTENIIMNISLQEGKRLFTAYHSEQKRLDLRKEQFNLMYKKFKFKRVILRSFQKPESSHRRKSPENVNVNLRNRLMDVFFEPPSIPVNKSLGLTSEAIYYGCERNSPSCIGQVFDSKPFYMYLHRNTPPCCMEKLKNVFYHVIEEFENVGIRYWLDNTALRSAIETNSLSLDAYEIDISFNINDLGRSESLKKSQVHPVTHNGGFYWIKATDGQYFKVQFSKINQIGVTLLPFELNADQVRPSGFYGWKAKEFSSEFLHPMSTVMLLGKSVMCPNNVREYLDLRSRKD